MVLVPRVFLRIIIGNEFVRTRRAYGCSRREKKVSIEIVGADAHIRPFGGGLGSRVNPSAQCAHWAPPLKVNCPEGAREGDLGCMGFPIHLQMLCKPRNDYTACNFEV